MGKRDYMRGASLRKFNRIEQRVIGQMENKPTHDIRKQIALHKKNFRGKNRDGRNNR